MGDTVILTMSEFASAALEAGHGEPHDNIDGT